MPESNKGFETGLRPIFSIGPTTKISFIGNSESVIGTPDVKGYNCAMDETAKYLERLARLCIDRDVKIATAESCTGGLIAKSCTDIAGSSDWFERGFVTYSNEAKSEMIGVPATVIRDYGAVSEPVAMAMAGGALKFSHARFSVAVTGVAGPGGGSEEKPVGTVWIAVASSEQSQAECFQFDGGRDAVRQATLLSSLRMLSDLIDNP